MARPFSRFCRFCWPNLASGRNANADTRKWCENLQCAWWRRVYPLWWPPQMVRTWALASVLVVHANRHSIACDPSFWSLPTAYSVRPAPRPWPHSISRPESAFRQYLSAPLGTAFAAIDRYSCQPLWRRGRRSHPISFCPMWRWSFQRTFSATAPNRPAFATKIHRPHRPYRIRGSRPSCRQSMAHCEHSTVARDAYRIRNRFITKLHLVCGYVWANSENRW